MPDSVEPATAPRVRPVFDAPVFSVPARHNPRLQAVVERINRDDELRQFWRCANIRVVAHPAVGDSGEVHAHIVANAALKLLRLLREAGHNPAAVAQHRLTGEEAEVIVVLLAAVHDLGLTVHAEPILAAHAGLVLAERKCRELLAGVYSAGERTIIAAESLHAIAALEVGADCSTLEAGLLKLAESLDLTKGRGRLPAADDLGQATQAAAVEEVIMQKAKRPPVRIVIRLRHAAGLGLVEARLKPKLRGVRLASLVEIVADLEGRPDNRVLPLALW